MKKHTLIWLVKNIVLFVILFITMTVLEKLIFGRDNWLYYSLACSIAYVIGVMLKQVQAVVDGEENTKDNVITRIGIILFVFILVSFVTGVVLNIENWFTYTMPIVYSLAVAIFLGTGFSMKNTEGDCNKDEEQANVDVL